MFICIHMTHIYIYIYIHIYIYRERERERYMRSAGVAGEFPPPGRVRAALTPHLPTKILPTPY